ncbi:hypothetical protein BH09PSE4_BH09PSE4_02560 [soil metagenome]
MMAVYRLKGLGWFVSGVIVALGFYLVSLQVAAERKRLDDTGRSIAQAHRDMRELETEFQTRANLAQLEKWNGDVLALAAPTPAQYVSGEAALASLDFTEGGPRVQMASLVIPTAPAPQAAREAAVSETPEAPVATIQHAVAEVRVASVDRGKAQAMAMLDRKLLSDSTLGDILSGARAEAGLR